MRELSSPEMQEVDGGVLWVVGAFLSAVAIYDAAQDFVNGVEQGYADGMSQK